MTAVPCKSNRWGAGCGHNTTDHLGPDSPNGDCCCCTGRHNDAAHVDTCLDCSILHGKRQVRLRTGVQVPTAGQVEEHIPEPLRRAFWERYIGKYFDEHGVSND